MCGRHPRVKGFFGFLLAVGCKSCVRPVCAVLMTAGPDVIRRSGPYQNLALDGAGPNPGFTRSPVQPVRIKRSSPSTFLYVLCVTLQSNVGVSGRRCDDVVA